MPKFMQIVYVLGSTRSGTSALRNAIAETRFSGYGEGHLTPILSDLLDNIEGHRVSGTGAAERGTGLFSLKPNVLIRHFFHGYERYLASQFESEFIVDKTPTVDPIRMAPLLNKYHVNAKFIYCVRRHVDNVQSKRKKFADHPFPSHCREWAACHESWLKSKVELNDNFLEMDFHRLVTEPSRVAQEIATYLELPEPEMRDIEEYLLQARPETSKNRDLTQFLKLSEIPWTSEEKQIFQRICGKVGTQLNYGYDTYFDNPGV
ncbi:sulfotransferase [Shimia thalassica]|uniref:sulfotransferase n=1 Tax=Shimia thalassica TaxID=1715693 RepID=UPI0026E46E9B|nr:sulfotransferase [Shimia thalassica]MDP2518849.1 sulfotransferase [Shimia thalassica]